MSELGFVSARIGACRAAERAGRCRLKPRPLTQRELKAFRLGYLAALGDIEARVSERRIRIAARSVEVEAPKVWPSRPVRLVKNREAQRRSRRRMVASREGVS